MVSHYRLDSRCDPHEHGYTSMEHMGIQRWKRGMDHGWYHLARMEPHSAQCRINSHIRSWPVEMDLVASGTNTGRTILFGGAFHLVSDPTAFVLDISEMVGDRVTLSAFIESVIWLNNTVGLDNWFYDGMKYYFRCEEDLVFFKLSVLHEI